ncbi:hypothetical protein AAVH_30226 [Aphelenchoides avenae]|nr:hypothetical protein AAVH_30226 [Aphelenchus avenae]
MKFFAVLLLLAIAIAACFATGEKGQSSLGGVNIGANANVRGKRDTGKHHLREKRGGKDKKVPVGNWANSAAGKNSRPGK